jgi:phospholipase C
LLRNPTGPYPSTCANFNQDGLRVPFVAISPFSKPHYISHTAGDHGAIVKLIETRFLGGAHLTKRDPCANSLQDPFDFQNAPSMNANVQGSRAAPPTSQLTETEAVSNFPCPDVTHAAKSN